MKTISICSIFVAGALATGTAHALEADDVIWGCDDAGYVQPTQEYKHGVLGDDTEYKGLMLLVHTTVGVLPAVLELPEGQVYEDLAPRCGDLDGDGEDEVVTVISDAEVGARLAVYSKKAGPIDQTPPIGQGFRWLAPIGIGDFDGDGQNDVAYVETPHIGGTIRVWTLRDGKLAEITSQGGYSNHKIGQDFITGGVRDCGAGAEMIVPNFSWDRLMSVRMESGALVGSEIGSDINEDAVKAALDCTAE